MWVTPAAQNFPKSLSDRFTMAEWINLFQSWMEQFQWFSRAISGAVVWSLELLEVFLLLKPWLFVVLLFALPAIAYGGLRLALIAVAGVMFWGSMAMWDSAMSTLSLMGISVLLSVIFGVMLGVACSQNNRVANIVSPILDTMQTMPAFVYLIPAIFFFGIGGAPAVMATMIYALPPVVRLTNLGIRQVPATTMEAATSFGSNRAQRLLKVQIPLAMPSIMAGINQTIMMGLGLVVLATFVGAGGLGYEVWSALRQLNIGWALEGGISIVLMAVLFDRLSCAMCAPKKRGIADHNRLVFRLLPQQWDDNAIAHTIETAIDKVWRLFAAIGNTVAAILAIIFSSIVNLANKNLGYQIDRWLRQHAFLICSILILVAVVLIDQYVWLIGDYPQQWQFSFRAPVDNAIDWLTVNSTFIGITKGIRAFLFLYMLNPLSQFLTGLPWWYVIGLFGVIAWMSVSARFAVSMTVCMLFIGACGLWWPAMNTIGAIIVSVIICFIVGVPLGIAAAHNHTFDTIMKPLLDAMQTMPAFVYLIPVLMFFGGNTSSAVIAMVIYALPPVIRLTTLGVKQIPVELQEVSGSFGANSRQRLAKLELPLAVPSITIGLNQAVMMAFAMQVITPLIGGGGLGREVFNALNTGNLGLGLQAGIAIVLLAIFLDRLLLAWSRGQRKSLGMVD